LTVYSRSVISEGVNEEDEDGEHSPKTSGASLHAPDKRFARCLGTRHARYLRNSLAVGMENSCLNIANVELRAKRRKREEEARSRPGAKIHLAG
jgi:hypothetical protein